MIIIQKISRLGETNKNSYGSLMTIVEYNNANDLIVEFENGYRIKSCYKLFKNQSIKNPEDKTVYGVGYIGIGEYKTKTKQYEHWQNMMSRCYNKKTKRPTHS